MTEQIEEFDPKKRNRSRLKLLGLFIVAAGPVVLAMSMYFGGIAVPDGRTNKGNLILPPMPFEALLGPRIDAESKNQLAAFRDDPKWALVVAGDRECDDVCETLLHLTKQVHVSMGREMERVSRYLVSPTNELERVKSSEKYPRLTLLQAEISQVNRFQSQVNANLKGEEIKDNSWNVWIVDPLGNVMMRYSDEHTGYDMIADLKRLLKLSKIG